MKAVVSVTAGPARAPVAPTSAAAAHTSTATPNHLNSRISLSHLTAVSPGRAFVPDGYSRLSFARSVAALRPLSRLMNGSGRDSDTGEDAPSPLTPRTPGSCAWIRSGSAETVTQH